MKPFKTYEQQLAILRDRGLTFNDEYSAINILERENYYSLINGYKDLFLLKDIDNKLVDPERYIDGTTFDEIYALYSFDRDLRSLVLKELLKFECNIKSQIAYYFSEAYSQPNAYLNMVNYSRESSDLKEVLKLISIIFNVISRQSKKGNPIGHYLDKHDGVPLWVMVNYLTMGNIQNFYMCITESLKNKIAREFSKEFKRNYEEDIKITPDILINILKTVTLFRNACAHEERLYNFKLYKPAKSGQVSQIMDIENSLLNKGNMFTITAFLKLVLTKKDYTEYICNLSELFMGYSNKLKTVSMGEIQETMGFREDWKTIVFCPEEEKDI